MEPKLKKYELVSVLVLSTTGDCDAFFEDETFETEEDASNYVEQRDYNYEEQEVHLVKRLGQFVPIKPAFKRFS